MDEKEVGERQRPKGSSIKLSIYTQLIISLFPWITASTFSSSPPLPLLQKAEAAHSLLSSAFLSSPDSLCFSCASLARLQQQRRSKLELAITLRRRHARAGQSDGCMQTNGSPPPPLQSSLLGLHFGSQREAADRQRTPPLSSGALLWFTHVWWQAVGTEGPPAQACLSTASPGTLRGSSAG